MPWHCRDLRGTLHIQGKLSGPSASQIANLGSVAPGRLHVYTGDRSGGLQRGRNQGDLLKKLGRWEGRPVALSCMVANSRAKSGAWSPGLEKDWTEPGRDEARR